MRGMQCRKMLWLDKHKPEGNLQRLFFCRYIKEENGYKEQAINIWEKKHHIRRFDLRIKNKDSRYKIII